MVRDDGSSDQVEAANRQVVRRRRVASGRSGLRSALERRRNVVAAGVACALLVGGSVAYASSVVFGQRQVGTHYADGIQVSDDQTIDPIGDRLLTEDGKFMGSTVSPGGRFLAASSTDRSVVLQIFDLKHYKRVWTVGEGKGIDEQLKDPTVGQEGPTYSPDGKFLWLGQKDSVTRFAVKPNGTLATPKTFPIAKVKDHSALVAQMAFSPDGRTLYAAINGQNTVVAMNPRSGKLLRRWNVGIAPRELHFVGRTLYVSDEGGRRAKAGEFTMDSYGTAVPADGTRGTATTGTVSLIDTAKPKARVASIPVGLHPTAMYRSGSALFVANTTDDTVSVIDTRKRRVVQTIETKPWPSSKVGYEPTGITTTHDGHLLVSLGRANAVAVYKYEDDPQQPVSYVGLLPTDYYPSAVASVGKQIVVTNTRGIDARGPALTYAKGPGTTDATGHGTHSTTASLTRFTLPSDKQVARDTDRVFRQNGWGRHDVREAVGSKHAPLPVPTRVGDPSPIKHVFLLVKENRSYDQVYGDMPEGNGDAKLAQFGEKVTPNQHALARQFGLYDNTYDVGTNSAEGHNWLMQGDNPEYTESSAGEYERSYDTEEDVLGHQRSGFLWTAVQQAGATAKDYGEYEYMEGKPSGSWQQYFCAAKSVDAGGDPAQLSSPELKGNYGSVIPSLNAISDPQSPPFDTSIPDIYRYEMWKQDFEQNGPSGLNMMWLSSDHTGGTADPEAQVADGDLAVGKIVDTISHSPYWASSAIFVVEDDSQDGADHVDGHRAPIQIISPWAEHGAVNSTYYSQIGMVRTIEQILGAQPLNAKLAAAAPMYGAFTNHADLTPFTAVPNQVPLTEGVKKTPACGLDTPAGTDPATSRQAQLAAVAVPAAEQQTAAAWKAWLARQHTTGSGAIADYANPAQMNRLTWYETHDWKVPYPGEKQIFTPAGVPGAYLPSPDAG